MRTDRRGFIGALLAAPLLARLGLRPHSRALAARGILRTGGTLKDLADYSQNFAMNYDDVFLGALRKYDAAYRVGPR